MGFDSMGGGVAGIAPHLAQQRIAGDHRAAGAGEEQQHRRLLLGQAQAEPGGTGHLAGIGIKAKGTDGDEIARRRLFEPAQQIAEAEGLGQPVIGPECPGLFGGKTEQQHGLGAALAAQFGAQRLGLGGAGIEQQQIGFDSAVGQGIASRQQLLAQNPFDGVVAAMQKNTLGHGL